MPVLERNRKFYLRAPSLDFQLNGPIKIGNVITDMTLPQDPVTFFHPLPNVIPGSGYGEGRTDSERHAAVTADLSAKIYDLFGAQAESNAGSSTKTTYTFDGVSALYLEKNPTSADAESFREKDQEFRDYLRHGPVYVVTGLKIAKGLRYSSQLANEQKTVLSGGAHVADGATVNGRLEGERGRENTDSWTVLGDTILAYRLHIIKRKGWTGVLSRTGDDLRAKSHDPGDAGFMSKEDKFDEFQVDTNEVVREDVELFATDQEYEDVRYEDLEDGEEEWSLAVMEE